jgi:inner membrane protein YidH
MASDEKIADTAVKEQQNTSKAPIEEQHVAPKQKGPLISKRVTDHLANERTFLAWIRTGLSIIAFGFVVERFGLLLRELGLKLIERPIVTGHYSTVIGITLTLLGSLVMIVALANFLQARRSIDQEHFHPHAGFAVLLTIMTCLIGVILAIYLYFTT